MNLDDMLVSEADIPARKEQAAPDDWYEMVREFNALAEMEMPTTPTLQPQAVRNLRMDLMEEELWEFYHATGGDDGGIDQRRVGSLPDIADAIGDIVYVAVGAAQRYGIDLRPIMREIHAANMRKRGKDGKMIRRADGKILKPDGWVGPDIAGVLRKQGWRG